jgi:hypothetical protein
MMPRDRAAEALAPLARTKGIRPLARDADIAPYAGNVLASGFSRGQLEAVLRDIERPTSRPVVEKSFLRLLWGWLRRSSGTA